jgi:uncharacterized protein YjbI with pentapeptide repeats
MANEEHLNLLKQGIANWNEWRSRNPPLRPELAGANLIGTSLSGANLIRADLSKADLSKADLSRTYLKGAILSGATLTGANLSGANLIGANLSSANLTRMNLAAMNLSRLDLSGATLTGANLSRADLSGTDLSGAAIIGAKLIRVDLKEANLKEANLSGANLSEADLSGAHLKGANLVGATLTGANLSGANLIGANLAGVNLIGANLSSAILGGANLDGADLRGANLRGATLNRAKLNQTQLIGTDISHADLTGCSVYGIAAWDVKLTDDTRQESLIITPPDQPVIMVDNIKVAQFIYLLLHNEEIRAVIDTITSKAVLILGRFADDRKRILNALREALRTKGFLPIVFDFERPRGRDFSETIMTLAGMSCFVIVDITNPRSTPVELQATVPDYMIPFVPILQDGEPEFSMFSNLQTKYDWVLRLLKYDSSENLIEVLDEAVIDPALEKRHELELKKAQTTPTRHVADYRRHSKASS